MERPTQRTRSIWKSLPLAAALVLLALACAVSGRDEDDGPQQAWSESRGPVVPHDSFPSDCSLCHEGSSWSKIKAQFQFDHAQETGVPLLGAHANAQCLRCHNDRGPVEVFAQKGCIGCHVDVHAGKLGSECTACHDESSWRPSGPVADHSRTRFPLVGAHAAVVCTRCHPGADAGNFDRASTACADCHADDLARATNPDHAAQGWVSNCQSCHAPTSWSGGGFTHAQFPLTGAHANAECLQCHTGGTFVGAPNTCVGCHLADYQTTSQPPHASAGFSQNCRSCHSTVAWQPAQLDHSGFPLTGAHLQADCNACHSSGVYDGLPTTCVSCHQDDFNTTTSPNHVASGYPTSCEQCHTTVAWTRTTFNHSGVTRNCAQCHTLDYNQTSTPNHATANFPTTCQTCHTTAHWTPSTFNHTSFPLTGAHTSVACATCHVGGVYDGLPSSCVSCHQNDYNQATSPNHVTSGYPTTCEQCHTAVAWSPANFNHAGVTRNCVTCHLGDYNQTNDPNHTAAGFPTTCQTCHDTVDWGHGQFNHTWFPIQSGNHSNLTCQQCHPSPRNYGLFTCTDCHEHRQSATDPDHDEVNNYVYNSNACYACHPNGHGD